MSKISIFFSIYYGVSVLPTRILKDEKGNKFTVDNPATYSFKTKIPEWYIKTATVMLKDTTTYKIGDYVSLLK